VTLQAMGNVVCRQDRHFAGMGQSLGTHHGNVSPCDGQYGGTAEGRCRHDIRLPAAPPTTGHRMAGQELSQMLTHPDRAHARATAAVGNAEGLVQIQVGDVCAKFTRCCQPDQGVEICAVHVDLTPVLVHQLAELDNGLLKHPMGGRVGHHDRGQPGACGGCLGPQVVHIHVASVITGNNLYLHTGHNGRRRIGAVGGCWNQALIPVTLSPGLVVASDSEQPGVFTLGSGIGLE